MNRAEGRWQGFTKHLHKNIHFPYRLSIAGFFFSFFLSLFTKIPFYSCVLLVKIFLFIHLSVIGVFNSLFSIENRLEIILKNKKNNVLKINKDHAKNFTIYLLILKALSCQTWSCELLYRASYKYVILKQSSWLLF